LSFVILSAVQDAEHDHGVGFNTEKEFVREAVSQDSAEPAIVERETFGIGLKAQQSLCHGG
jgi:hypothetical protein